MLKDSRQRSEATDPRHSFIVQAPAGSGKTEILTQRYLRLLSTVSAPEQIVALTFTRKAASEMRERILQALQKVAQGNKPQSEHQQQTFAFAAEALNRSKEFNWQLLDQPNRLRVMTIDSLCQALSQAIPIHDKQSPYAQISEDPQLLYRTAARACLNYALENENYHSSLKNLLSHLDNRQDRLHDLLTDLLANRDQWLSSLYFAREQDKTRYEQMLTFIEQHELERFQQAIPLAYRDELCLLARQVASIEAKQDSPRYALSEWFNFELLDIKIAKALAALLLTSEDKLRKSFDHHVGLKRGVCADEMYNNLKTASKELLANLDETADFLEALVKIKILPEPHYDAEQWQMLQALFTLLPLLAGHLQLIFNEQNEVDFSAVSQQALLALGDEEQPTDLALYLDNAIHHLLIDEFQDTSIQQYQLLTKLVQGWQIDDGRTLFIVGDPMQSIYRFRQAEVGLFLKAQQEGIGPVQLNTLELCCNFRSTATIVNWVNQQFKTIFPAADDIESGSISFHPSVNVLAEGDNSFIKAWQFPNRREEAQALVKLAVQELEANPQDEIAILVRSRNQLADIMTLLREQQIPFQGVDIELLSKLPHLRDLWSLTQALLLPANRLAWLAFLRSPFCGLSLSDLHLIANFDRKKSIYYALTQLDNLTGLSEDGRLRGQYVYKVLADALARRHQQSIVDWISSTVTQLQVDKILDSTQRADLEQFWLLLERFTKEGQLPDLTQFANEFDKLYSKQVNPSRLQVMTIHKSKGLEFDSVILPGLSTKSQNRETPLLRWLKLPSQKYGEILLVSPIKAAHHEECLLYNYLAKLDAEKDGYELQRLLYVAATRAKKRLFLFDSREKEAKGSFRSLLKNQEFLTSDEEEPTTLSNHSLPLLCRLPDEFYHEPLPGDELAMTRSVLQPSTTNARQLGIIAHELLQWICNYHPSSIDDLPWSLAANRFRTMGFSREEQTEATEILHQQIRQLFDTPIGQWLSKAHIDERNEYELLINEQGVASTKIIDRTFIEQGQRWIIDFKTGSEHEDAQAKHREQVNGYAKLFAKTSTTPIRCGLYYLASGHWVEWVY